MSSWYFCLSKFLFVKLLCNLEVFCSLVYFIVMPFGIKLSMEWSQFFTRLQHVIANGPFLQKYIYEHRQTKIKTKERTNDEMDFFLFRSSQIKFEHYAFITISIDWITSHTSYTHEITNKILNQVPIDWKVLFAQIVYASKPPTAWNSL